MNRGELRAYVRLKLKEPSETAFRNEDINAELDNGYRDLARRTHCFERKQTITSVANQLEYTLDNDVVTVKAVLFDGNALTDSTRTRLQAHDAKFYQREGSTPQIFATRGMNTLIVYPKPTAADKNIDCYIAVVPSAVSNAEDLLSKAGGTVDDNIPNLPEDFHILPAYYAIAEIGGLDLNNQAAAARSQRWFARYEREVGRLKQHVRSLSESPLKLGSGTRQPIIGRAMFPWEV